MPWCQAKAAGALRKAMTPEAVEGPAAATELVVSEVKAIARQVREELGQFQGEVITQLQARHARMRRSLRFKFYVWYTIYTMLPLYIVLVYMYIYMCNRCCVTMGAGMETAQKNRYTRPSDVRELART